ncbi:uncharacterized protein LY89DRAFT_26626 [Mollisia scopiformis]|uniref:Uncharacterized protein n=1 Tax=Mollisia scopiformis TaxID=149040 RepID=A0A194XWJ3_MOLSC|nr:uncharacterized protein LY89DRAFT_26626 [Mollisia scopiformis]KUJ24670.1 hypothetical protein LY89DRAFT_26626 [Mollisia scopiformis]
MKSQKKECLHIWFPIIKFVLLFSDLPVLLETEAEPHVKRRSVLFCFFSQLLWLCTFQVVDSNDSNDPCWW